MTISVFTLRGGVGKTTLTVNLAAGLARRGHKVLAVDLNWDAGSLLYYRRKIPGVTIADSRGYDPNFEGVQLLDWPGVFIPSLLPHLRQSNAVLCPLRPDKISTDGVEFLRRRMQEYDA